MVCIIFVFSKLVCFHVHTYVDMATVIDTILVCVCVSLRQQFVHREIMLKLSFAKIKKKILFFFIFAKLNLVF